MPEKANKQAQQAEQGCALRLPHRKDNQTYLLESGDGCHCGNLKDTHLHTLLSMVGNEENSWVAASHVPS
jgi:hypothetical protein